METVKLLAIFCENKAGQLARVTGLLAQANINIRWVTIATSEAFGVIKLLADDCEMAYRQLKYNGVPVSWVEVLAIEVDDQPGGLHAVASCLAANQVNIENASAFVSNNRAILLIEVQDVLSASRALEGSGLRLVSGAAALQQKMW